MSIKAFGILELKNELTLKEKIELSFLIVEIAIKNKFGVNLGGNIFSGFRKKYEKSSKKIFILEITDDPLDINAECLFAIDGLKIEIENVRIDSGECLSARMLRVQNFLQELLQTKNISKIILEINSEDEEHLETVEVMVNNFCSKILQLYKPIECLPPSIRIIINAPEVKL